MHVAVQTSLLSLSTMQDLSAHSLGSAATSATTHDPVECGAVFPPSAPAGLTSPSPRPPVPSTGPPQLGRRPVPGSFCLDSADPSLQHEAGPLHKRPRVSETWVT